MKTQTIEFAVETKNGAVHKIGKSAVCQPKTNSKGSMKWYQDIPAIDIRDKNQKG